MGAWLTVRPLHIYVVVLSTWLAIARGMELNLTVPDFTFTADDMYVCTTIQLPPEPMKLVGVIPRANMKVVHHILLFGCKTPYKTPDAGSPRPVWSCMNLPPCADGGYNVMYGWGRNAPELHLPQGVGFSVGADTGVHYVVAQVHYLSKERPKEDHSGVCLVLKPEALPFAAGVMSFAAGFAIPPRTPSYLVSNDCCYQGHQPLHTFAMRVHTHELGRSVYMTRQKYDHSGLERISEGNPQLPQAFYPVQHHVFWPGDRLNVTCDFDSSSKSTVTHAGNTHKDEMCNMYMMVYGWHPFISMCGGMWSNSEDSPGSMSSAARFTSDPSPFWAPPKPLESDLGVMTSVAIAADGAIWGLYRGGRYWDFSTFDAKHRLVDQRAPIKVPVVVRMDPDTGKVLSRWGANTFYLPHSLTLDREGNVFVVDVGAHQVMKFTAEGQRLFTIGMKLLPGKGNHTFCQPTKVAVMRDGTFFLADGYCNSRIVKFSPQGKYLAEVEVQQGAVIHHVLVDECSNLVYAVSRENSRVVSFNIDTLQEVRTYSIPGGRVWSLQTKPHGGVLALVWEANQPAKLVDIEDLSKTWELPGLEQQYPHEVALGPAPLALSGAGDRLHAAYVVSTTSPAMSGPLHRLVLLPVGRALPGLQAIMAAGPQPLGSMPGPVPLPAVSPALGQAGRPSGKDLPGSKEMSTGVDGELDEGGDVPGGHDAVKEDGMAAAGGSDDQEYEQQLAEGEQLADELERYEADAEQQEAEQQQANAEAERAQQNGHGGGHAGGQEDPAAGDGAGDDGVFDNAEELRREAESALEQEEQDALEAEQEIDAESDIDAEEKAREKAEVEAEMQQEEDYEEEAALGDADYEAGKEALAPQQAAQGTPSAGDEAGGASSPGETPGSVLAKPSEIHVLDMGEEQSTTIGKIVALVVFVCIVASLVVALALQLIRKFATPSVKPGSAGANTGFIQLKGLNGMQKGQKQPLQSIEELLESSRALEANDVESPARGMANTGNGHVNAASSTRHHKGGRR